MTLTNARFDRELPALLEDLYLGPTPSYRDEVLAVATHRRQRPAWAIPGRWLPMADITSRPVLAPPLPWRTIGLALVVVAIALAVIAIAVGSRQPRPATPFGPAANGHIAFAVDGDIFTADPETGEPRALVTGPEVDRNPVWSLDGTRVVFERVVAGAENGRLYVARADGSGLTVITQEPLPLIKYVSVSPDGREVMFVSGSGLNAKISIARIDGTGVRTLDLPMGASEPAYRPPNGAQIAFTALFDSSDMPTTGVYVANADGSGRHALVGGTRDASAAEPRWSPDGSLIADAKWSYNGTWSNDGQHMVMIRGYSTYGDQDVVAAVVPVDGSGPGRETARNLLVGGPTGFAWAPDDRSILVVPAYTAGDSFQPQFIDPATGQMRATPWASTSVPAWQRLAP
jgi:hypothetical protein